MTFWSFTTCSDFPTDQTFNFMALIPSLTLTELREVSMEHLRWVWHTSKERLAFRPHGSVPVWDFCICSNYRDQFVPIPTRFSGLFTSNIHRHFLDFTYHSVSTKSSLQTPLPHFQQVFNHLLNFEDMKKGFQNVLQLCLSKKHRYNVESIISLWYKSKWIRKIHTLLFFKHLKKIYLEPLILTGKVGCNSCCLGSS